MSTSWMDYPSKFITNLVSLDLAPILPRLAVLVYERYALVALLVYVAFYIYGSRTNLQIATQWFKSHEEVLRKDFAGVGMSLSELFAADTPDSFSSWSTGRRGAESLTITLRTTPLHDLLKLWYNFVRGVMDLTFDAGVDKVVLDFKLKDPNATPGAKFCFAVVNRNVLRATLDSRWDLRTFTYTAELVGLPKALVVQAEHGDVTDSLLKQQYSGLLESLLDPEGMDFFDSLVITDGPAEKPDDSNPVLPTNSYHLILTLRLPPSASRYSETTRFVSLCGNLIDVIYSRHKLVGDLALYKLRKKRAEVNAQLMTPLLVEKLEKEKAEAEAKRAKKKVQENKEMEEKLKKMTKAQRIEFLEKEEKRKRKEDLVKIVKKVK